MQASIDTSVSFKPAKSHIHVSNLINPLGSNGAVVVDFTPLVEGESISGCVDIDAGLYDSFLTQLVSLFYLMFIVFIVPPHHVH